MSSISPSSTIFSPSRGFPSPYKYEDPSEHQIPRSYPNLNPYHDPASDETSNSHKQHQKNESTSSDSKSRLRKACDSCSVRKVKCDEHNPCKSCVALEIPCTFNRPSRRRGPPNKHAEAIKRQKVGHENSTYAFSESSPTHDAAYSLAALSAPVSLSAESICDMDTLNTLLDDYFIFIHPLIPIPHEPTFRAAWARRDDRNDRSFLALLASMIETLVASFPRRPRQLFTSDEARARFPNAGVLLDKCHQVFNEARGIGFLDRFPNLYDACSSYLTGLVGAYLFDMHRFRVYISECVIFLRSLNYHRPSPVHQGIGPESPAFDISAQRDYPSSYIEQESGCRLFWLCFVGCLSLRQLGSNDADLLMPPMSHAEMLPHMPHEVDDEYIFDTHIATQPTGIVSALTGFNLNVRIFRAFHSLIALEMAFGTNELYDWDRQRRVIRQALSNVKAATNNAPTELQLQPATDVEDIWPQAAHTPSAYSHLLNGFRDPTADVVGLQGHARRDSTSIPYPRRAVQYEIQKANIYATQLATRSYLVEKFWNLYEIRDARKYEFSQQSADRPTSSMGSAGSPTVGAFVAGVDYTYYHTITGRTPSDGMDAGEQAMSVEREDIVRDLAMLLRSIKQVNMEPNGLSFCNKIRQVASTLLDMKRARMSVMPTLDSEAVNTYLLGFLDILVKLERLGTTRIRSSLGDTYDSHGNMITGNGNGQTAEQVEEEELVCWASLKEHQERFVMANGFVVGV